MTEFIDYYEILEVSPNASSKVIERAYKTLIFDHHPDRGGDEETAKQIIGAYYVLSDASRRAKYDEHRALGGTTSTGGITSIDDIPDEVLDAMRDRFWAEMSGAADYARLHKEREQAFHNLVARARSEWVVRRAQAIAKKKAAGLLFGMPNEFDIKEAVAAALMVCANKWIAGYDEIWCDDPNPPFPDMKGRRLLDLIEPNRMK